MNETPPPMHEPNASAAPTPRETLAGDRLCMRCLHPLAGRAIERDAQSGLLFVRCGECGTAAALFEYPTLAPWLGRLKSVVAGTLVVFALLTGLAMAGVATGFTIGTALECVDSAADALSASSIAAGNTDDGNGNFPGRWSSADTRWLATDAGRTALAETRWSPIVVLTLGAMLGLGGLLLMPMAVAAGVALTARATLVRAACAALPVALGGMLGAAIASIGSARFPGGAASWTQVVEDAHGPIYRLFIAAVLAGWCAIIAMLGPAIAAGLARLVLPPRDRRLVAWLWEWRGKRVPNR